MRTVTNKWHKFGEGGEYVQGWLDVGHGLQAVVLTRSELARIVRRAEKNPEDLPQPGLLRRLLALIWSPKE